MEIEKIYTLYSNYYLADTDTRSIRKNTVFFALKGANFNGNAFAAEALAQGASLSIIDDAAYFTGPKTILVDNVLETLQALARYHRKQLKIPVLALTGSNGKTTTKELISAVLSKKYRTTATHGNLNNHIGVPLTLLSMTPKTEIGIVEMGANHQKEIAFLCSLAAPDYGYITNFGKAHLEGFGGMEGVVMGKSELYTFLHTHQKTAFINPKDALQKEKTTDIAHVYFPESITFKSAAPFVKVAFEDLEIQSNLVGDYNYANIAAAIAIGLYFKIPKQEIKTAISEYVPSNNRSQIIHTANNQLLLDAYNANPSSMKAAVSNFANLKAAFKTVILGDMFELGTTAAEEHQEMVDFTDACCFENTYYVGALFSGTTTKNPQFKTFEALEKHLHAQPLRKNSILIKGSRGMRLERLLNVLG
ncbi:UDP-N-acetylmuramoylalanyl-D-glutamyl-2, 6-diaminopimelate-D-alanyl-D-alanyl ligase [Polaribacter irgensii 23-P]|uniref:UDP-N-acetylmuramoyl-tripeptide--D-alanyl-D-alanine ligase n=1 Tax=Polaribacter irgensii 23-P TaxID=313594 RepID=A4BYP1_9FLAO|nr:UDP-N-acetylmuramoyl-tripeptide--D-alanyl-D-alanine ligase [Polaribacter irgensii]EAR12284.1 UDP-N-acetylmuramoylalanyl-D-glutamyl-2, 6-diaminopimelate-D-alanyl-D-alanyl ligase [Polaribacter irgensii 23-P]